MKKIQMVNFSKDLSKKSKRRKKLLKRNLYENRHLYYSASVVLSRNCEWIILYKSIDGRICKNVSFDGKTLNTYEFDH